MGVSTKEKALKSTIKRLSCLNSVHIAFSHGPFGLTPMKLSDNWTPGCMKDILYTFKLIKF